MQKEIGKEGKQHNRERGRNLRKLKSGRPEKNRGLQYADSHVEDSGKLGLQSYMGSNIRKRTYLFQWN